MRILLISRIIAKTGVGNHILQLYNELVAQGHEVWVVASTNDMNISTLNGGGYRHVNLNTHSPFEIAKNLFAIRKLISDNNIEIVHCHHRMASLYMRWYNRIWKCPYVYTLHLAPIPSGFVHRMVTSCGDQSIAISQEVGEFLKNKFKVPENRISYVLNGVDESKLIPMYVDDKSSVRTELGIGKDKIVVALHARITQTKGQLEVAKAMTLLNKDIREKIVILCSGEQLGDYYNELQDYLKDNLLDNNFIFCGWRDARTVIGCADLMMLPSTVEGFGLNCIEAMFLNVPVARSKMGGSLDMKEYVYTIDKVTPKCIADCLSLLIQDYNYFTQTVAKANDWANRICTISAMTKNTVNVYKKVLQRYGSTEISS